MSAILLMQEGISMAADSTATGMVDATKEVLIWDLINLMRFKLLMEI